MHARAVANTHDHSGLLQTTGVRSRSAAESAAATSHCAAASATCGKEERVRRTLPCVRYPAGAHGLLLSGATSFVYSPLLKRSGVYTGLMHGVDWLPTIIEGVLGDDTLEGATRDAGKPLDGHNMNAERVFVCVAVQS